MRLFLRVILQSFHHTHQESYHNVKLDVPDDAVCCSHLKNEP